MPAPFFRKMTSLQNISARLFILALLACAPIFSAGCLSGCGGGGGSTPAATTTTPAETVNVILSNSANATFTVVAEIADTDAERALGLMNRTYLAPDAGMLFVYAQDSRPSFWMKNTLIPLDMIYINSAGIIADINHSAQPGDLTPFSPSADARYVLEVNGGYCNTNSITTGDAVVIPAGY